MLHRAILAVVASGAALMIAGAAGCEGRAEVATSPQPEYVEEGPDVVAPGPPPAPIVETYGVAPGPDYIWIGGSWLWTDGNWRWHHGYWSHRPHEGAYWVEPHWDHGDHGWQRHHGYWR